MSRCHESKHAGGGAKTHDSPQEDDEPLQGSCHELCREYLFFMLTCSGFLLAVVVSCVAVYLIWDYLDESDIAAAQAFRDVPKESLNGSIVDFGVIHRGDCFGAGRGNHNHICTAGHDVDVMCQAWQLEIFPMSSPFSEQPRSLRGQEKPDSPAKEDDDSSRMLAPRASCALPGYDVFVPWLLIEIDDGQTKSSRCAYPYGTLANSGLRTYDEAAAALAGHIVGRTMDVWTPQLQTNLCILGFSALDSLITMQEVPLRKVGAWCSVASLLWLAFFAWVLADRCILPNELEELQVHREKAAARSRPAIVTNEPVEATESGRRITWIA
eukprot:TRINITY_DN22712_c0_g1_i2.p1 TRINITY_DN22712_c0_g1~~TRINITY_DN22712_c0_g1_i2.p1  ORF type:complete len:326 (+),score=43.74 TRINITY_DN22712_c0_g1_i2:39-1016(+)